MRRLGAAALGLAMVMSLPLAAQRAHRRPVPPRPTPPPAPVRVEHATPFKVGETLTYDVSWSSFLTAGTAITTVQDKRPSYNSTAYYIVAEARPTPLLAKLYSLYYKIDTLVDAYTLLSQRGAIYSEEGKRHRFRTTVFDRADHKAHFEYQTATTVKADFPVPPDVQDALSALYVLRTIPLKAGGRMTMPIADNGITYTLQVEIAAPERIKMPAGETSAWKLKPAIYDGKHQPVGHDISIWLSDDARRLPLRIQGGLPLGTFVLTLRGAT